METLFPNNKSLILVVSLFLILSFFTPLISNLRAKNYQQKRLELVNQKILGSSYGRKINDSSVIEALKSVPRHKFVPSERRNRAYKNRPLPIGHGQTISQPYIVARMTDLLNLENDDRVLEIGTGSGYQAAILAEITKEVYTIEIIEELHRRSENTLKALNYQNIVTRHGDGYYGWKSKEPFDAIIVTAAPSHIPPPLVEQLSPGGRMVIPVGHPLRTQRLMLLEKQPDGTVTKRSISRVRFVPFRRNKNN